MSAYGNQPTNQNFLSPVGFSFKIKKTPLTNYFVQSVTMPSVTLESVAVPNPFVRQPYQGTQLNYGDLSFTFKVDENLANYLEIYNWMQGLGFPKEFNQFNELSTQPTGDGLYSDLTLLITTSAKNANKQITFYDAFPISLSELQFDATQQDFDYLTCTVDFKYGRYVIGNV